MAVNTKIYILRQHLLLFLFGVVAALQPAIAQRGGPAPVITDKVDYVDFADRIEAVGTLYPKERVDLSVNVADRVTGVYFQDGERVRRGQTLLVQAQTEQLAEIEGAEATVREAQKVVDRMAPLVEEGVVSGLEFDQAQRDLQVAQSTLVSVQARQKNRILVAPFSGILGFRQVSSGAFLAPGDPVATLVDDSQMFLDLAIPDIWLANITPGLEVSAVSPSLPNDLFEGKLVSIDNEIDPETRSLRVRALVPNPDQKLKAGLFMSVTLLAKPRQTLSVTESAIEPLGSKSFVYLAEKRGEQVFAKRVEVEIGARFDGRVEILAGLSEGDTIISEGLIGVRDGRPVRVQASNSSGDAPLISLAPDGNKTLRIQ